VSLASFFIIKRGAAAGCFLEDKLISIFRIFTLLSLILVESYLQCDEASRANKLKVCFSK